MNKSELLSYKTQLLDLLKILECDEFYNIQKKPKSNSIAYAEGLHILISPEKLKNVMSQSQLYATESYKQISSNVFNNLQKVYAKENHTYLQKFNTFTLMDLLPSLTSMDNITREYCENLNRNMNDAFNEELYLIFNQGKQHSSLYNKNINIMAYMKNPKQSHANFDDYKAFLMNIFNHIVSSNELLSVVEKYYKDNLNKKQVYNNLKIYFNNKNQIIENFLQKVLWLVYTQGNIYQLAENKTQYVKWQTSQCLHDCITCRGYQRGENIIVGNDIVPGLVIKGQKIYEFPTIQKIMGNFGMDIFSHSGCKCSWVSL